MRTLEVVPSQWIELGDKVLANALAVGDVDGDGSSELVIGTIAGQVTILKLTATELVQWKTVKLDECVTAICIDDRACVDKVYIMVATMEGNCHVFPVVQGEDAFDADVTFRIPLNARAVALLQSGDVAIGTEQGNLSIWTSDPHISEGFRQVAAFDLEQSVMEIQTEYGEDVAQVICGGGVVHELRRTMGGEGKRYPDEELYSIALQETIVKPSADIEYRKWQPTPSDRSVVITRSTGEVEIWKGSSSPYWRANVGLPVIALSTFNTPRMRAILLCTSDGNFHVFINSECVRFRSILPPCAAFHVSFKVKEEARAEQLLLCVSTTGKLSVYRDLDTMLQPALQRYQNPSALLNVDDQGVEDLLRSLRAKGCIGEDESNASPAAQLVRYLAYSCDTNA